MKYSLIISFSLLCLLRAGGLQAQTELQDPTRTSSRSEMPGIQIGSYNSRELALTENDKESLYMQRLNGKWQVKTYRSETEIDTTLTAPAADVSAWESVTIPEKEGNGAWAAVYRTEFTMPFKWIDREIFVRLDAVSRAYYVYANGHLAGYHADSKTPAYFDITPYVADGKNTLAVIAYAHPVSTTLENQIKTPGTCIEGDVSVIAQPKVRIRDFVADTRFATDGNGLFSFGAIVKSHLLNPKEVIVYYELIAPDDSTVIAHGKRDARFHLRAEDTVRFFANLPDIQSWSHESPKLYTVALKLQHEGRFTEYTKVKLGFRDVSFNEKGLKINGRPVELRAVDYDCPPDANAWRRDFAAFKKRGINCVRVKNYPQNDRFYELADSYGLYICNRANIDARLSGSSLETGGTPANDPLWENAYADRVMNMYYTSQNHPSVLLFSLGEQGGRGYNMYEAYRRLKAVEKKRPVIYEGAGAEWNSDLVVGKPGGRNASDDRYTVFFASPESFNEKQSPLGATAIAAGTAPGKVEIRNGCTIADLKNFRVGYTIVAGTKRIVKEGVCKADIPAGETALVDIPLDGVKPGKYTLTVHVAHKDNTPLAPDGERILEQTLPLEIPKTAK